MNSSKKLERVRRGLLLTMLAPSTLFVGLVAGPLVLGELQLAAFVSLCLSALILLFGQVFCLSAPAGKGALALCLLLDVAIVFSILHSLKAAALLALLSWISLLTFLAKLGDSLEYPRLREQLRPARKSLNMGVGLLILGLCSEILVRPLVDVRVTAGNVGLTSLVLVCVLGGTGWLLNGMIRSFFLLGVGADACKAQLAKDDQRASRRPSAIG